MREEGGWVYKGDMFVISIMHLYFHLRLRTINFHEGNVSYRIL